MTGELIMDLNGLIRHHNGDGLKKSSQPGVVGPKLTKSDERLMMRTFWCDHWCPVNKYDEDGNPDRKTLKEGQDANLAGYTLMTITQMRDHLVDYHVAKGHYVDSDFLASIAQRAAEIEAGMNQMRKAREEVEANELTEAKKAFAKIQAGVG